ncbi:MAG: GNAT family N-acetyltransferase [Candidatus Rickettsia vulgarisii]
MVNNKLVGCLFYQLLDNKTLYLAQYFIIPEFQRQKIGYYVIDQVLPKLYPEYKRYEVLLRYQNDVAILLYNKLGFTIGDIDLVKKYSYDPLRYMSFYKDLN